VFRVFRGDGNPHAFTFQVFAVELIELAQASSPWSLRCVMVVCCLCSGIATTRSLSLSLSRSSRSQLRDRSPGFAVSIALPHRGTELSDAPSRVLRADETPFGPNDSSGMICQSEVKLYSNAGVIQFSANRGRYFRETIPRRIALGGLSMIPFPPPPPPLSRRLPSSTLVDSMLRCNA
jgi:hypothetical protein